MMLDPLQRKNYELTILNQIAEQLNRSVDLDEAISITLAQVATLLDVKTGWVWLLSEETGEAYLAASQGLPPALRNNPRQMEGRCHCLNSYHDGDLAGAANVNVIECSRLRGVVDGTDGLLYHASIPLYAHGKKLGIMNVVSSDWRELPADELRLLYTIGDLLGIAIERSRLFAQSTELGAVAERNRLAREIHDTLAQSMAAVALQLESADALLDAGISAPTPNPNLDPIHTAVMKALHLTRINIEEVRRSVLDLRAAPLQGCTLAEAFAKFQTEWDLPLSVTIAGGNTPLPVRLEVGLYRIAQEALNNVVRHAEAKNVSLNLTITPKQVTLMVADDGKGFDPNLVAANRFGLIGLNERARLLGGELHLDSVDRVGTQIMVHIPLE